MSIAYTSRIALRSLISDVERHHSQKTCVYEAVRNWKGFYGPSREDIAKTTQMRLSSVCGRVSELVKEGVLTKGPMKEQEVVPGRALMVETLSAVVYRDDGIESQDVEQLSFL